MSKVRINKRRHIFKSITWSLIASATTFFIGLAFGLEGEKALLIVLIDRALKLVFYYGHERAWFASNWGVLRSKEQ